MRRGISRVVPFVIALIGALSVGCGGDPNDAAGVASAAELVQSEAARAVAQPAAGSATAAAIEAFATDLYAVFAREEGNVVFSPYSAAVALSMTRAGAVGETARQMDGVLHASLAGPDLHAGFNALEQALAAIPGEYPQGDDTVELELATANQLWGQRGFEFEQPFLDRLAGEYGAGMRLVDFIDDAAREEARAAINGWVAERTRDRVPELIPENVLDELTRLVLTNAIYLNAPWLYPFDDAAAASGRFHLADGSEVEADLMELDERLRYGEGDGYQAVELPYAGDRLSMIAVVPDEGRFDAFESAIDANRLREVIESLGEAQVRLRFPRFAFRTPARLKDALIELGMPIAFTDDADFSGMSPQGERLLIDDVLHEAFIAVDELGTEAAAATAVVVRLESAAELSVDLTVDRPFLFLIRDRQTGALLFMGRVLDPTA